MNLFSVKYSLRSFFRDIARGFLARTIVYPRIAKNEFSQTELASYIAPRLHKNKTNLENAISLQQLSSATSTINKNDLIHNIKNYTLPYTFKTLLRNKISTSGSTGQPLTIIQDLGTSIKEEAFVYRQLRWAGYTFGDRRAWIRGDIVCDTTPHDGFFGCRDWWSNTLMLSSYHISAKTAQNYMDALAKFDPVLIQAYPSSIHALASWMIANNKHYAGPSLRAIMTSSETLEETSKDCIEKAFGCKVYDWYGQAERVAAIGTCEHGRHHILTDYGQVELLPENGSLFEIVGTSYNNNAMLLSRYRTGDLVSLCDKSCPCGRVFPTVKAIIGRRDKSITLSDGRQIGRLDHLFKNMDAIIEGQVVYCGENNFILRIVTGPNWRAKDSDMLIQRLHERVGGVTASIEIVNSIPRGANGKFEFIRLEKNL